MPVNTNPSHRAPAVLLEQMWPEIQVLFERYEVPEKDAEAMVQDMLIALLYKWDSITNHGHWLKGTLENRCRRRYGEPAASTHGANGKPPAKSGGGRKNGKSTKKKG